MSVVFTSLSLRMVFCSATLSSSGDRLVGQMLVIQNPELLEGRAYLGSQQSHVADGGHQAPEEVAAQGSRQRRLTYDSFALLRWEPDWLPDIVGAQVLKQRHGAIANEFLTDFSFG